MLIALCYVIVIASLMPKGGRTMNCPKCGNRRFFVAFRVIEYHYFDATACDGSIEHDLISVEESCTDDTYTPQYWCDTCAFVDEKYVLKALTDYAEGG
jgi:hypothetical protein